MNGPPGFGRPLRFDAKRGRPKLAIPGEPPRRTRRKAPTAIFVGQVRSGGSGLQQRLFCCWKFEVIFLQDIGSDGLGVGKHPADHIQMVHCVPLGRSSGHGVMECRIVSRRLVGVCRRATRLYHSTQTVTPAKYRCQLLHKPPKLLPFRHKQTVSLPFQAA